MSPPVTTRNTSPVKLPDPTLAAGNVSSTSSTTSTSSSSAPSSPSGGQASVAPPQPFAVSTKGATKTGDAVPILGGKATLYRSGKQTEEAAFYAHGAFLSMIPAESDVSVKYLSPHKTTVSGNPSAVELKGTHGAVDNTGMMYSYTLTPEDNAEFSNIWGDLAKNSGKDIAVVHDATTTQEMVKELKSQGYKDVLACHCREVHGADNMDWDPFSNVEIQRDNPVKNRSELNGFQMFDDDFNILDIDSSTALAPGDQIFKGTVSFEVKAMTGDKVELKPLSE